MVPFNSFVVETELIGLPLNGRRFTWSKLDGTSMSRIDHFLVSKDWLRQWPGCTQQCLEKGLYDRCPIVLGEKILNWRPRPFRMLSCWKEFEGYREFIEEKWRSLDIQGWGHTCSKRN